MFGSIGFPELILIFIVALIVFGPNKLPEIAKTLGKTMRDFRKTVNDAKSTIEAEIEKVDTLKDIKKEIVDIDQRIAKDLIENEAEDMAQEPAQKTESTDHSPDFYDLAPGEPELKTLSEPPEPHADKKNEKKESQ